MGGRIVAALYIAVFAFAAVLWFFQIISQIVREILHKGGGEKMSKVNERNLSLYEIAPWEKLVSYQINLKRMIEEKLRKRLPKEVDIVDIDVDVREIDNEHVRERIEVVLDLSKILGQGWVCAWFEGMYYNCQDFASEIEECNEDSPRYNDEECRRRIEECVESQLEEFREENCGLPFYFNYKNPPTSEAKLVTLEDEDSYRYCCGVGLRYRYTVYPFKTAMKDIIDNAKGMGYTAEQVVSEVVRIVNALRALA